MTNQSVIQPEHERRSTLLARLRVVRDSALPAHLTRLHGPDGSYVLKQHRSRARYEQERDAYRYWVPCLADLAPRLVAADDAAMTLLVSAVEAVPADRIESRDLPAVYRAAGQALRRLHDLPLPEGSIPRAANTDLARRLRGWIARAGNLISAAEVRALVRAAEFMRATPMEPAACHLDYQPCNWLVHSDGHITVVDFEHARVDARIRDLARLAHRHWIADPALKDAFLDGYGHLSSDEEQLLREFGAYEAITALVRGTERHAPDLIRHGRAGLARLTAGAE